MGSCEEHEEADEPLLAAGLKGDVEVTGPIYLGREADEPLLAAGLKA
mgnify:CR=1 FL=1